MKLDFEKMGLKPIIYPLGYGSTMCNKQYWFDHKFDEALYLDKAFVKRKLEVAKQAFENRKDLALKMAGPAVIEIFGENPFEPESKKEAYKLTKEQQKLSAGYINEYQRIVQEHIPGDERSFTIIAFPIPEFGHNFKEMFDATVKINTLDSEKYEIIQNKIIDELDKADYVRVVGKGDNRTYINVKLHELKNPEKETNFENCLADVNIPLGEVFTSPVLKGTNGVLHVSEVYLGELKYKDLEITTDVCKFFTSFKTLPNTKTIKIYVTGHNGSVYDFNISHLALYNTANDYPWQPHPDDASLILDQETVFNALTNNGTVKGLYSIRDPKTGQLQIYFNANYIQSGTIKGDRIDARNLTVTRDDGVKTIEITDKGEVNLVVNSFKLSSTGQTIEDFILDSINLNDSGQLRYLLKQIQKESLMLFSLGPENPSGREEKDDEYEHKTGSCGCKKRIQHKRTCFRRNVYCTDLCIYSICKC